MSETLPAPSSCDMMHNMQLLVCGAIFFVSSFQITAAQDQGWHFRKDDPQSKRHIIQVDARSMEPTTEAGTFLLHGMTARLYDSTGSYKEISSKEAIINEEVGTLAYGPGLKATIKL